MPKIRSLTHISVAWIFSSLGPHERESGGDEYFNYWFPASRWQPSKLLHLFCLWGREHLFRNLIPGNIFIWPGKWYMNDIFFFLVNGAALNISCLTYRIISKMFQWQKTGRDRQGGKEDEIPLCLLFIPYSAEWTTPVRILLSLHPFLFFLPEQKNFPSEIEQRSFRRHCLGEGGKEMNVCMY